MTKGRGQRTGLPERPSIESGIFELDVEDGNGSRKPSGAIDTPRLAEIRETSSESVRPVTGVGEDDSSPRPAPLTSEEQARPTTAGPGALHKGVWSDEGPETKTGPRQRKKSVLEGGVIMQELDDVDDLDILDDDKDIEGNDKKPGSPTPEVKGSPETDA